MGLRRIEDLVRDDQVQLPSFQRNARREDLDALVLGKFTFDELKITASLDPSLTPLLDTLEHFGVMAQRYSIFVRHTETELADGTKKIVDVILCGSRRLSAIYACYLYLQKQNRKL